MYVDIDIIRYLFLFLQSHFFRFLYKYFFMLLLILTLIIFIILIVCTYFFIKQLALENILIFIFEVMCVNQSHSSCQILQFCRICILCILLIRWRRSGIPITSHSYTSLDMSEYLNSSQTHRAEHVLLPIKLSDDLNNKEMF